jgi:transposase-like protein
MKRNHVFEEARHKVAQEALGGIRTGVLARKYQVTPNTIRNWVREYQDKYGADALPTIDERVADAQRLVEMEAKYGQAVKALGEKELENQVLRELLKKSSPASMINSTLPKRSSSRESL